MAGQEVTTAPTPETCPDCGRPIGTAKNQWRTHCTAGVGVWASDCTNLTITRLRSETDSLKHALKVSGHCIETLESELSTLRNRNELESAVVEAARYVVRLHHHPMGEQHAENALASLMTRLDELDDALMAHREGKA